jgi:hypothetical protein
MHTCCKAGPSSSIVAFLQIQHKMFVRQLMRKEPGARQILALWMGPKMDSWDLEAEL